MNPWIPHMLRADGRFGAVLPTHGRTLLAKLKSSLTLDEGTGGPTWSRATKAWRFNELGYLQELASGCAAFGGARLVRNTVNTKSEDVNSDVWTKTNCTVSGPTTVVSMNETSPQYLYQSPNDGVVAGRTYRIGIRAKYVSGGISFIQLTNNVTGFGTIYANINLQTGESSSVGCTAIVTPVVGGGYDISISGVAIATGSYYYVAVALVNNLSATRLASLTQNGVRSFKLLRAWSYDVTNYDASYVPEYVSVGVEASPYFGAGIDGAKYFETDWQGAPIPAANLLGFRRETSATNNLLHSRDLSNAAWSTKTNITAAKTATGLDGIANTSTTLTATAADAIILQPITLSSAARCASAYVKRRTGTGTISFTQDGGSSWTDITSQINSSTWSRVQITSTLADPSVGFKISTSGDAIDVDCVQNEAGANATSPIVTTIAAVSRNVDSLTYPTASNFSDTAGTMYGVVEPVAYSGVLIGSAANGLLLSSSNSGAIAYDGANAANGPTGTPGTSEKLAVAWSGSEMKVASSGSIGSAGTYDGAWGLSNLGLGAGVTSGYIGNVAIYSSRLTDAELQAITT